MEEDAVGDLIERLRVRAECARLNFVSGSVSSDGRASSTTTSVPMEPIFAEAAAEIARLRGERDAAVAALDQVRGKCSHLFPSGDGTCVFCDLPLAAIKQTPGGSDDQ